MIADKAKKPLTKHQWLNLVEKKVYSLQKRKIERACGEVAANCANYGWGVSHNRGEISVCTKVYVGDKLRYLSSIATYPSLVITHEWVNK